MASAANNLGHRTVYEISRNGKRLFGIVDMMYAVGSYDTRRDAARTWRRIRDREQGGTVCPAAMVSSGWGKVSSISDKGWIRTYGGCQQ